MSQSRSVILDEHANLFRLRIIEKTLVVTFPRPCHVLSWAILNGGMRTHASHIINHQVESHVPDKDPRKTLRCAASKIGIKGMFVGMMTGADVRKFAMAKALHEELQAYAIATVGCGNLATAGETGTYVEGQSKTIRPGTINVILLVNYRFTREAMLEAMAITTEAKVRAMYEFDLRSVATGQPATGTGTDCIALACGHDRRYVFCGKHTKWGELVGKAALESVRGALLAARAGEAEKG